MELEFPSIDDAKEFREDHPDALLEADNRASKTVSFDADELGEVELDQAEALAATTGGEAIPREQRKLSEDERDLLEARPSWTWQENGAEAMWVKGTLTAQGATEWLDFYESGEGVEGALANMERSAERSAATGAQTGQRVDRDPATASAERMSDVATGPERQCDHAEDVCIMGDPEACEFLREHCGFTEADVRELKELEEALEEPIEPPERDVDQEPDELTGAQLDALERSWGGYMGAVAAIRRGEEVDRNEELARKAFDVINQIRAEVDQEPLEPEALPEALQAAREVDREGAESGQEREKPRATGGGSESPPVSRLPVAVAFLALILWFIAWATNERSQ